MRLDKYLKVARILKRRTVSKELAANQRVVVNGKTAKPATEVNVGDIIEVTFGSKCLVVRVLDIRENVRKNDASVLYEILEERRVEESEISGA